MLTKNQLNHIAENFQIDTFTVFREYLQLLFLNYLYQEKLAEKVYFKGGTCLRLLYNSPRFSEDLDFSTTLSIIKIKELLKKITNKLEKEIQIKMFFLWLGKNSLRYKIKYQGKEFKYPLSLRLDFTIDMPLLAPQVVGIKTKIPINFFPLAVCLSEEEILAEKIRAFLMRAKGRDIFDFWYLAEKGIKINQALVKKKLKQVNLIFKANIFWQKIKQYPQKNLTIDLAKFLPLSYRKIIPLLKEKLTLKLKNFAVMQSSVK